jgi:hypothetical protein
MVRGPLRRFAFRLRIPRSLAPGEHTLTLAGPSADESGEIGGELGDIVILDDGDEEELPAHSLGELEDQIAAIGRWDGVTARFGGRGGTRVRAYLDPVVRIGGEIKLRLRIRR